MDVINSICKCIKVLCDSQHGVLPAPSTTKTDAFIAHLKNNINLMLSEVKAQPKFQELQKTYEKFEQLDSEDNVHWNFVTWCLILLSELHDSLSSKAFDSMENTGIAVVTASPLLSISQQKAIENCLQFVIALGILPNLLPGVGVSLRNRTEYAAIVKHVGTSVCPRTKYKRLVASLTILLKCTSHILLQSIIIARHAGDLLAAFFQLCYAPIKKMKEHQQYSASADKQPNPWCDKATDGVCKNKLCCSHKKLINMLEEITDNHHWTEDQLIHEMWNDRHNFLPHLEILLQKICPEVLIWELFLLQGLHHKSAKETKTKTPLWLRKLCNQMLTENLLRPQGLKLFIRIMLDKTTDSDLKEGAVDKAKVDAVARLISSNPVQNMSFEEYVKHISPQVIDILCSREEKMACVFTCVASSIMLQFAETDRPLAEKYIFRSIFKELWTCLDKAEISRCEESAHLVKEDALALCIENAYKVFVFNGVLSQQNIFSLLLPFYHLLFIIFSQMQSGVSFLCPQLKGLLVFVVKSLSVSDALTLLRLVSFEDVTFHPVQYVNDVKCVFGDSGGIVLIKNSKVSPEDLLDDINRKCSAVMTILNEVSDKKLKVSHFLSLLKRLTDLSMENTISDEKFQTRDFQNNLTLLQQLQEMAETIGEDLGEDIVEAVHFIKLILEKAVMAENSEPCQQLLFGSETVVMSLVILSTIVEYKNQLSSLHWRVMKECLPSLEKFVASSQDSILKNMCENLIFAIATHGAAGNPKACGALSSVKKTDSMGVLHPEKVLHSTKLDALGILNPVSGEMKQEVLKEAKLCEHPIEILHSTSIDSMMQTPPRKGDLPTDSDLNQMKTGDKSSAFKPSSDAVSDFLSSNKFHSEPGYSTSSYEIALKDLNDSVIPVRGHGLIMLTRLINEKNEEALAHKENLLKIFMENLSNEDSYIYLASIQGLSALADIATELVLPTVLKKFSDISDDRTEVQLKLGEVLLKICKNLGEMTVRYGNEFIHAYLCGAKHKKPEIRASSLSNLGEVCRRLTFSLGPFLQEILLCVLSLLKTDEDIEVRRSAALVITLLLQGTGKDAFEVLETEMKELYCVLRHVHNYEKDDVLKLHAQLALEEINVIVKKVFCDRPAFTKEIRILDPF